MLSRKEYQRQWKSKNPDKWKKYAKRYYQKHRKEKKFKENRKKYREKNKVKLKEYKKKWKEKYPKYDEEYYQKNKEDLKQKHLRYYYENKESYRQRNLSLKGRWIVYKVGAKRTNKVWSLSFNEFKKFWQKPCYYCGGKIETIGLDRIDNQRGYFLDNVVPCCYPCNSMKGKLSKDEFIKSCKKIVNFTQRYEDNSKNRKTIKD